MFKKFSSPSLKYHLLGSRILLLVMLGCLTGACAATTAEQVSGEASATVKKLTEAESLLLQGNNLADKGYYKKALAIYRDVYERFQSTDAVYNIAVTLEANLNQPREAMLYYTKFIMLEKKGDDVEKVKAWLKALQKEYQVKRSLQATLNKPLPRKAALGLQELLAKREIRGQYLLSEQEQEQVDLHMRKGAKQYARGDYPAAVQEFQEVLRLYDSIDACYNLGVIYEKQLQDYAAATFYYQRYLQIDPSQGQDSAVSKALKRLQAEQE